MTIAVDLGRKATNKQIKQSIQTSYPIKRDNSYTCYVINSSQTYIPRTTVVPAKSDSDVIFCLQLLLYVKHQTLT